MSVITSHGLRSLPAYIGERDLSNRVHLSLLPYRMPCELLAALLSCHSAFSATIDWMSSQNPCLWVAIPIGLLVWDRCLTTNLDQTPGPLYNPHVSCMTLFQELTPGVNFSPHWFHEAAGVVANQLCLLLGADFPMTGNFQVQLRSRCLKEKPILCWHEYMLMSHTPKQQKTLACKLVRQSLWGKDHGYWLMDSDQILDWLPVVQAGGEYLQLTLLGIFGWNRCLHGHTTLQISLCH